MESKDVEAFEQTEGVGRDVLVRRINTLAKAFREERRRGMQLDENLTSVQNRCSELLTELRGHRAYMSGYAQAGLSGLLSELVRVRYASDCKHGSAADQVALPDGTGTLSLKEDLKDERVSLLVAKESGGLTWRHILVCEVAEAIAESDPTRLRAELIDVANVALKWAEAISLRDVAKSERA